MGAIEDVVGEKRKQSRTLPDLREDLLSWRLSSNSGFRAGPHQHEPPDRSSLNLQAVFREFPASKDHGLNDASLWGHVVVALINHRSAREAPVARGRFLEATSSIATKVNALRRELRAVDDPTSVLAAVLHQINEVTKREAVQLLSAHLDNVAAALVRVKAYEPERGPLSDQATGVLVYELCQIYWARTGRKPSPKFDYSADDKKNSLAGNEFARFVVLVEEAYIEALKVEYQQDALRIGEALNERVLLGHINRLRFGTIRTSIRAAIKLRRAEKWR